MPAPVVVAAGFGIAKAATWIVGIIAGAWATNKVVQTFGSTPARDLNNAGIPPGQQYAAALEAQQDKKKFLDKLNEEKLKENKQLKEQLDKLKKKLLKQTEEWKNESDPGEKARKLAIMKETENEVKSMENKIAQNNQTMEENNKKILEALDSVGNPGTMSQQDWQSRSNSINLTSVKNYGIIFICIIVMFIIIGLAKKLYASLTSAIK